MQNVEFRQLAEANVGRQVMAAADRLAILTLAEILPAVMRPVPRAWRRKPNTYGAYKRQIMRNVLGGSA